MHWHSTVVELFRPFLVNKLSSSTTAVPAFVTEAYLSSYHQLQWVVYHYATTYGGPPVSVYLTSSLLSLAYSTMLDLKKLQSRFFFSLTIKFLGNLTDQFPVIRYILQGMYQSAKEAGDALPREALDIFEQHDGTLNRVQNMEDVESSLPVDLNRSVMDPEGARLSNLIRRTEGLVFED